MHTGDLISLAPLSYGGYGIDADWIVQTVEDGQNVGEAATYNVNTDLRVPSQCKTGAVVNPPTPEP